MSLFSAITHDGTVTKEISRYGGLALVLGVAVAIAAALALTNDSRGEPSDSAKAVVTNWQTSRFIEINTTDIERPIPAVGKSSIWGPAFISVNTTDLEYPGYPAATYTERYTERWNGPR